MPKILDSRMVAEVDIQDIKFKPNVRRVEIIDDEEVITYVVLTTIIYWLLDAEGSRLRRVVRRHDLIPLSAEITSLQFINNLGVLQPLAKAAAIADNIAFCGT